MQPKTKVKKENNMNFVSTMCYACLSSDRKLNVLGEYGDIYWQICTNTIFDTDAEILLCWECQALLRRVLHFQKMVEQSQRMLSSFCYNDNIPASLSHLKITDAYTVDTYVNVQNVDEKYSNNINTEDIKPELPVTTVKQENTDLTDLDNGLDHFDNFEYGPVQIKDEILPETFLKTLKDIATKEVDNEKSKENRKRKTRYKLTYQKFKNVVKRIAFKKTELDNWLERERSSDFYKSLVSKCGFCVTSTGKYSIEQHNKKFHTKSTTNTYECEICHTFYAAQSDLSSHINRHYFYYNCSICGYECYDRYNIRCHIKGHDKVVQCLECEQCFLKTRQFYEHYKKFHTLFTCDYCSATCRSKHSIQGHIYRYHTTHKCRDCNLQFSSYKTARAHYELRHRIERSEASYCVQCDIQFDTKTLYRRHVQSAVAHTKERHARTTKSPVPCPECSNVYARKSYMMNHYRLVHAKQSNYFCTTCDKYFLNRTKYKDHMLYFHEGREKKRNKICQVCGRGFYNNRILANHVRTHTGERPFECQHCDAKFAQQVALQSHIKFIHLKNKRKSTQEPDTTAAITIH